MRRANGRVRTGTLTTAKRKRGKRQQPLPPEATACSPVQWCAVHCTPAVSPCTAASAAVSMQCTMHSTIVRPSTIHYIYHFPSIPSIDCMHCIHSIIINSIITVSMRVTLLDARSLKPGRQVGADRPLWLSVCAATLTCLSF